MVEIYTDGSTRGNGYKNNSGGFGVCVIKYPNKSNINNCIDYLYNEQVNNTTNNRMELQAIIAALQLTQVRYKNEKCIIKSDSAYCVNMINDWIYKWRDNNWTRYKGQPIENLDLVKQIWEYLKIEWPNFTVEKVPGHSNVLGNIIADYLATNNLPKLLKILKENDIEDYILENIDLD